MRINACVDINYPNKSFKHFCNNLQTQRYNAEKVWFPKNLNCIQILQQNLQMHIKFLLYSVVLDEGTV